MALIEKPAEIIKHIITEEVGASVNTSSYSAIDSLENKLAFTVHDKQVNSKKLIEEIASNTRVIPYFKNNELKMQRIKPDVQPEREWEGGDVRLYIDQSDIISYTNKRTPPERIYTEVIVNYHYDYALKEFTKNTKDDSYLHDTATQYFDSDPHSSGEGYNIASLGLSKDQDYTFDAHYIRDSASAEELQQFLLLWHCNQHNILKMKLPLKYIQLQVGDYIGFNELINGVKLFGEDYSIKNFTDGNKVFRNAQQILPVWMITSSSKTITHVDVELIQMHNCTHISTDSINFPPEINSTALEILSPHPNIPLDIEGTNVAITDNIDAFKIKLSHTSFDVNDDTLINQVIVDSGVIPEDIDVSNFLSDIQEDNSESLEETNDTSVILDLGLHGDDGSEGDSGFFGAWLTEWRNNANSGDSITFPAALFRIKVSETETEELLSTEQSFPSFTIYKDVLPGLATATISYNEGWNLVSIPVSSNELFTEIFPDYLSGTLFSFDGTYISENTTLTMGEGYWLYCTQARSVDITGVPFEYPANIPVNEGWNLVGVPSINPISASVYYDAGIISEAIYGYETEYALISSEDNLIPGKGYWMRASEANIITINPNA